MVIIKTFTESCWVVMKPLGCIVNHNRRQQFQRGLVLCALCKLKITRLQNLFQRRMLIKNFEIHVFS